MRPDPARCRLEHYPLQVEIATRYGDLDPQRHINNVAVAGYYEESRLVFHRALSVRWPAHSRTLVAHHAMDFLAELAYPAAVVAGVRIARIGRSSYTLHTALFQDSQCAGVATTVLVHADAAGPQAIPADLHAALERFAGPAPQ